MKLTFFGASGGVVTGSAYLLETSQARILVDFGQFQGSRKLEARNRLPVRVLPWPVPACCCCRLAGLNGTVVSFGLPENMS